MDGNDFYCENNQTNKNTDQKYYISSVELNRFAKQIRR